MDKYKLKVVSTGSFLYGGGNIARAPDNVNANLIIRVDEFGENIRIESASFRPEDTPEVRSYGELGPGEALTINLSGVMRVEGTCTSADFDSLVHCTIATHS